MSSFRKEMEQANNELLINLVMDAFHRIIVHYGLWFAEVRHQLGMERAMVIEQEVWKSSVTNQMSRLGKELGFPVENGIPGILRTMSRETLIDLTEKIGINWLANDGIWFQSVENAYGMFDAKRCNDTCWSRFSPFEANRIKELLNLGNNSGIQGLKKALAFRIYALINEQSVEDTDENTIIFRMNNCRVQAARKRKGLDDYPCKSGGMTEYTTFAETIDSRISTECIGCPPDKHPDQWFCAWKFTLKSTTATMKSGTQLI